MSGFELWLRPGGGIPIPFPKLVAFPTFPLGSVRAATPTLWLGSTLGLVSMLLLAPAFPAHAQDAPPCTDDPDFAALDFWVGEWTVWSGAERVGTNRIRKVQGGCAVEEHWESARGGTGQSLFYYLPATGEWKQVWVTPLAPVAAGGVKEKVRVPGPDGAVRFQGVIRRADGTTYLDRTTLTPLPDGSVRQHIEISTDDGVSWRSTFDAEYRPVEGR